MTKTLTNKNSDILFRIAAGDESAVAECISRYGNLIWLLARKLTPNTGDAEDAVQEIFVEIWKNAYRFDPAKSSESTFVVTISKRRLIDRLRKTYRRPSFAGFDEAIHTRSSVSTAARAEDRIEARRAMTAMNALRPDQREMMLMNVYEGMSHGEIAERLDVPLGTVKTNIRRGMQRLRTSLGAAIPVRSHVTA